MMLRAIIAANGPASFTVMFHNVVGDGKTSLIR